MCKSNKRIVNRRITVRMIRTEHSTYGVCALMVRLVRVKTIVKVFIVVFKVSVEQIVQNVTAAGGQAAAHMLPRMFGGHQPADIDEPEQCLGIPLIQRLLAGAAGLELGV